MLQLIVKAKECFDDNAQEFININEQVLTLEHSLISLSKWESKWNIPFLSEDKLDDEKLKDYVRCMSIDKKVDDKVFQTLSDFEIDQINEYISLPMTATTFNNVDGKPNREIITSEIIYYWMITYNIPFECQKWHINRLLTLIRVCDIKNSPQKKMRKNEILNMNRSLNEARKKKLKTNG